MTFFWFAATLVLLGALVAVWRRVVHLRREAYIRTFELPYGLFDKLRGKRPTLTLKDCQLVAHALRQFFLAYHKSGRKFVSMPSQAADDLWHEFILYTRNYQAFCKQAFGGFLHHTPAVALGGNRHDNAGLRRVWWHCCIEDNINPRSPSRLPLLFAIDAKLAIADGFTYVPDCEGVRRTAAKSDGATIHCGGDFSSSSVDGSTDGFGSDGGGSDVSGGGGESGGGGASGDGGGSSCGGGGCGGS
ncbi:MAG: hypothetical protein U1F54_14995 [Burkholderiales bacterium]